jgi:hypothetical protein
MVLVAIDIRGSGWRACVSRLSTSRRSGLRTTQPNLEEKYLPREEFQKKYATSKGPIKIKTDETDLLRLHVCEEKELDHFLMND